MPNEYTYLPLTEEAETSLEEKASNIQSRLFSVWPPPIPKIKSNRLKDSPLFRLLTDTSKGAERLGHNVSDLTEAVDNTMQSLQAANPGFQYAHLALTAIDFFRIPFLYFLARRTKKEFPLTPSKKLQMAYAGLIMALFTISLAVPVTAPFIGLAIAIMAFIETLVMAKIAYNTYKMAKQKIAEFDALIATETDKLLTFHQETKKLEEQLAEMGEEVNSPERQALVAQIKKTHADFLACYKQLQTYYTERAVYQHKKDKLNLSGTLNRLLVISLSAIVLAGAIVSFFFPPAGLGLIVGAAGIGTLFMLGKAIQYLSEKAKAYFNPKKIDADTPQESQEAELVQQNSFSKMAARGITAPGVPVEQADPTPPDTPSAPLFTPAIRPECTATVEENTPKKAERRDAF